MLFDHQIFDNQRFGGISRYYAEMIDHFRSGQKVHPILGMGFSSNHYLTNSKFKDLYTDPNLLCLSMKKTIDIMGNAKLTGSTKINGVLKMLSRNRILSSKAINRGTFDIFHPTYYDPYFLPHLQGKPFVLTIYDMIHERFSKGEVEDPTAVNKRTLAEKADIIIAISESTKRDIVELLGISPNKVKVTYLAGSLRAPDNPGPLDGMPQKYILYVGHRGWYKNFSFMLESLDGVFERYPDIHLISVGGDPFYEQELRLIDRSKGKDRIKHLYASDTQLAKLYANALVYVNPSRYEGFGIPVLEAMSCGCPALISNVSSLPEVGGSAAHYFDPNDSQSLQEAIIPLLDDDEARRKAREKGLEQAARFTWGRTAEETAAIYGSLV